MIATAVLNKISLFKDKKITDLKECKYGLTNHSYSFACEGKKYFLRLPGEGTTKLINRHHEKSVYEVLSSKDIADHIVYFDENTGVKITHLIEGAHNCDPYNIEEIKRCFSLLHNLHSYNLKVNHYFDLFKEINKYELYRENKPSVYSDYQEVKAHILSLENYLNKLDIKHCLCHNDSVVDNFLVTTNKIYLIDWEYAAMQDPDLDLAMFIIYAGYDKCWVDKIINLYYQKEVETPLRKKIYAYIAIAGFLWSNWCEYKEYQGVSFGDYAISQYRFAKDYYAYWLELNHEN